jgi:hypothetical protein
LSASRAKLGAGDAVAAAGGLVLFVSLFLPWYEIALDVAGTTIVGTESAWEAFGFVDVVLLLVALTAVAVPAGRAAGSLPAGGPAPLLLVAAGLLGLALVLFRLVDVPGPDIRLVGEDTIDVERRIGIILGLIGAAAIAGGATRTAAPPTDRAVRPAAPDRSPRGRPPARRPR